MSRVGSDAGKSLLLQVGPLVADSFGLHSRPAQREGQTLQPPVNARGHPPSERDTKSLQENVVK